MKFKNFLLNPAIFQNEIKPLSITIYRRYTSKIAVELNTDLATKLENNEIKPRYHPGITKTGHLTVPQYFLKGIGRSIGDHPIKSLIKDGQKLNTYFHARHPPAETNELRKKTKEIEAEIDGKHPLPDFSKLTEEEIERIKSVRQQRIKRILKQRTFAWKPMNYGSYESLVYAIGRSAQEFAILTNILKEIEKRDPNFKPRSYFDFGSGVGTGMWAASDIWKDSIFEYFNVDASRDMNNLSDLILRQGNENKQPLLKNVYYRQFLPASDTKYDLVVSAFSLLEIGDKQKRFETMLNLWKKCDGYFVIVEDGSRSAFQLINEVRDYLLSFNGEIPFGHVFAPCPHDMPCPRFANISDKTPCNFVVSYEPLGIGEKITGNRNARFSYVVLKKGKKQETDNWPRLVRQALVRSKHTVCKLCTSEGNLQEIIFTQSKHGKFAYRCARSSKWGDRLPIKVGEKFEKITDKKESEK